MRHFRFPTLRKVAALFSLSLITALPVAAPAQVFNNTYDGMTHERAQSVRYTSDGGFISAGYMQNVVGRQTMLVKTDGSGVIQWSKNITPSSWGSNTNEYPQYPGDVLYAIRELPIGGYVAVGYTNQYTSFPWAVADENVLIIRTDASGNLIWRTVYGGVSKDRGYNLEVTDDGEGIVVTGLMDGIAPGEGVITSSKLFVMKVDLLGQKQWCTKVNVTTPGVYDQNFYAGYAVQELSDGTFMSVGACSSPVYDWQRTVYAVRVSSTGGLLWANAYMNPNAPMSIHMDEARGLRQTPDGAVVISGSAQNFSGTAYNEIFLMKITPVVGAVLWANRYYTVDEFNTSYGSNGYELQTIGNDLVLAATTLQTNNAALIRFDNTGTVVWAKRYTNHSYGSNASVDIVPGDRDGGFILTGDPDAFPSAWHLVRTDLSGNSQCSAELPLIRGEVAFEDIYRGVVTPDCDYGYTMAYPYIYELSTESCSGLEKSGNVAPETYESIASLSPNPAGVGSIAGVNFTLANEAKVEVRFTDLTGIELFTTQLVYGAGQHTIALPTQKLIPGVYMAHITIDGVSTTQKLVIIR